ncbi:DUF3081 domain-containing protein [Thalassotalea sp. M1531]|uniref:DUF3081 domain-containing protein n=1 Tax=Thalassotalea algicola TaxID=2716224 RepID=A0A7Y0Q4V7_9GAMM|nr:DUF3081 family protein [Thalassotalea algicola]NMP30394.1 DUF3081 domain-containing protein [Thalassotalea algicola]
MKIHKYLTLFNQAISLGQKQSDGKYKLNEVEAWHDHDGYTCYLGYKDLVMTIYFHNKYAYDYEDPNTLTSFELLVERFSFQSTLNAV